MKLSYLLEGLFLISFATAVPMNQGTEKETPDLTEATMEENNVNNATIPEDLEGFERDYVWHTNNCKTDLRSITCIVNGKNYGKISNPVKDGICEIAICKACFEKDKYCSDCGEYLRNKYKFQNCHDVKIDLKDRSDHHL